MRRVLIELLVATMTTAYLWWRDRRFPHGYCETCGHDLTGQGLFAGDFEPNVSERATSPDLDASTWTNTKLLLYRRLNTGSTDDASIVISIPQGYPIYRSYGSAVANQDYVLQSYDVSAIVDGKKRVTIAFGQDSGSSGQYSGWNVDDVQLTALECSEIR